MKCPRCNLILEKCQCNWLINANDQSKCKHENFASAINVIRAADNKGAIIGFIAAVRVQCQQCLVPMKFVGLPVGGNIDGAFVSEDGFESRLAMTPYVEEKKLIEQE